MQKAFSQLKYLLDSIASLAGSNFHLCKLYATLTYHFSEVHKYSFVFFFFQPTNLVFYFKILIIAIKLFSRRGIENLDFNLVQWLGLLTYCIMQLLNVKVKMVKMHFNFLIFYLFFHFNFYISQKIVICMVQLNLKDFDSFG